MAVTRKLPPQQPATSFLLPHLSHSTDLSSCSLPGAVLRWPLIPHCGDLVRNVGWARRAGKGNLRRFGPQFPNVWSTSNQRALVSSQPGVAVLALPGIVNRAYPPSPGEQTRRAACHSPRFWRAPSFFASSVRRRAGCGARESRERVRAAGGVREAVWAARGAREKPG